MVKTDLITKDLRKVGQEIDQDYGFQMIKDFSDTYPEDIMYYYIGKNILESILAQPGCVGIRFFNALTETGEKTLVYIGLDKDEKLLVKRTFLNKNGELVETNGIVADRTSSSPKPGGDFSWWDWLVWIGF
jgi:hypothetical protein